MATDASTQPVGNVPTSHPIGFWFFFWGEFAERCSFYGMRAILALYLIDKLGFSEAQGSLAMSLFIAGSYFAPLLGGWIADNYLGKYWTIVGFSLPYILGHYLVGIEDQYYVISALVLLAMGSGVIKPNISSLMGMTYDQQRPGLTNLRTNAFSWFYLAINIGSFLSMTFVPIIRTEYGYKWGFLFPAGLMVISLAIFAAGKRFYAIEIIGDTEEKTPEKKAEERSLKMTTLLRIGILFFPIMFFWAIFDQSASTWVYFADTYMNLDLVLVDYTLVRGDQVQNTNSLFIIVCLPLFVLAFNQFRKAGRPVSATLKISLGFILCGSSMAILAIAGFLAGDKQDTYKITTDVGMIYLNPAQEFILTSGEEILTIDVKQEDKKGDNNSPEWKANNEKRLTFKEIAPVVAKMRAKGDKPVIGSMKLGNVTLIMDEFTVKGEKLTIKKGKLVFENGATAQFDGGRIDFANSTELIQGDQISTPGVLEATFKPGKYEVGDKTLSIEDKSGATSMADKKFSKPEDEEEETPSITLETKNWVKPDERVTVWWQILAYFILTLSEILISVTGLELAYVAAPASMKSFVTAMWLVTVGLANLVINAPFTQLYPLMPPGWYFLTMAISMAVVFIVFQPIANGFNRKMTEAAKTEINIGQTEAK